MTSPARADRSPSSTRSTSRSAPAPASASSAPTASARRRCCACSPGVDRPDRGLDHRDPANACGSATCPRSPSAATRPLLAFLARRTGVAAAEAELERGRGASRTLSEASRRRRLQRRARRLPRGSAGPTSTRVRARCVPTSACRSSCSTCRRGALSGGQAARASLAAILLSRFDVFLLDEPTNDLDFAGLDTARAVPRRAARRCRRREPRPRVPRAHGDAGARARRAHPLGHRVRRRMARLPRRARRRRAATPRRTTRRTAPRSAGSSNGRARSASGRCRARARRRRDPSEKDKVIRHFKVATSEKQAAKARATEKAHRPARRGREAVGRLGPALPVGQRAAQWRRRDAAPRRGGRAWVVPARPGRPRDRLGRAGRDRRPQWIGQDHAAAGAARATSRSRRASAGWAPASSWARWTRRATRSPSSVRLLDVFVDGDRAHRRRRALAPRQVRARRRARAAARLARCRPESARVRCSRGSRPRA